MSVFKKNMILFIVLYPHMLFPVGIFDKMVKAIKANNTVLFAQELNMHKKSGNQFLSNGETPLTLILNNCKKDEKAMSFISVLFSSLYGQLNQANKSGLFPLQIVCNKNLMGVAIELIQKGADPSLCEKNILGTKMNGKILINELTKNYITIYCNFLACCRNQQSANVSKKQMPYCKFNLENLIGVYLEKDYLFKLTKDQENKDIATVLLHNRRKIIKYLNSIQKKYAAKALFYFYDLFCLKKQSCKVIALKKIVSKQMNKLNNKISKVLGKNSMSKKMFTCFKKEKFVNTRIITRS